MTHPSSKGTKRVIVVLLLLIVTMSVPMVTVVNTAPAVAAIPCNLIPDPALKLVCEAGKVAAPLIPIPTPVEVAGNVAGSAFEAAAKSLLKMEVDAVISVLQSQINYINKATTPALTADWFLKQYALIFGMSTFIALGNFYLRIGQSVKNLDAGDAGEGIVAIIAFFIASASLPFFVGAAVRICDGVIAKGLLDSALLDTGAGMGKLINNLQVYEFSGAILIPIFLLAFGVIGGVLAFIELAVRELLLYLVTALEVFAFAMFVGKKWGIETFKSITFTLVGLIFFKVIMAFILLFGVQLLGSGQGTTDAIVLGSMICLLVPVLTWAAYKKISNTQMQSSSARTIALAKATQASVARLARSSS